jgi:hypothetical protein
VLPLLGFIALALWRSRGLKAVLARATPFALVAAVLTVPALFAAGVFSPTQGGLTDASELGNLIGPISIAQYLGIWPNGDFRLDPINEPLAALLIALAAAAALAGAWLGWRRGAWALLLYVAGAGVGSLAVFVYSSPWVGAKALASGSPSILLLALAGAAAFAARVEKVFGATVLGLLVAGVLWSNALGYHDASLAPYDQLRELESIGQELAGDGPTLMTEYQPYGVRHFLRDADAEGVSELRTRSIPLAAGGEAEKGAWVDTDQISSPALLLYRTLVLRRSPAQSRPPSAYSLRSRGDYYEVWQRPSGPADALAERLPLGDFYEPTAVPSCQAVLNLAALAGPTARLVAAVRPANIVQSLSSGRYPGDWTPTEAGSPDLVPHGPGTARLRVEVPRAGWYEVWIQGSVRNPLTVFVDGREVGSVAYQLNESSQFLYFGRARLGAGTHALSLRLDAQSLTPGSGGPPEPVGPLVLSPAEAHAPFRARAVSRARDLCKRRWDWVEAVP